MGIFYAPAFAIHSTYHTSLKWTPDQLFFDSDMVLNYHTYHIVNMLGDEKIKYKMIIIIIQREILPL